MKVLWGGRGRGDKVHDGSSQDVQSNQNEREMVSSVGIFIAFK